MSYGQNLVHGEGTSLSRVGPYRFCSGGTLYKPAWGYRFGYRFRVGPYRFCSDGNPTTLSILLWTYLILINFVRYSYTKKVSVPGRSCGCIEYSLMEVTSTYPYKPCWNPLSLGMEGGEMIWIVCWCLYSIRLFKPSLLSRPTSQNGSEVVGFSWCQCLVWQHR